MEINRILENRLKEYGILDETSFHVLRSVEGYRRVLFFPNQMHYLMYILGTRENGLQILHRCLKETQHRFPEHWMIGHYLESKGECNPVQHIVKSTTSQFLGVLFSDVHQPTIHQS